MVTRTQSAWSRYLVSAGVAKSVDARDLKTLGGQPPCRFESCPRHGGDRGAPTVWHLTLGTCTLVRPCPHLRSPQHNVGHACGKTSTARCAGARGTPSPAWP